MGCAQSTENERKTKKQTGAVLAGELTRQMTVGEAMDHKMAHNSVINKQLEAAREEVQSSKGKWIWGEYTDETRLLGRGAFARVFMGRHKATNKLVAIKVISKDNKFYEQQQRAMVTKIACMRALQGHRSMVKLFGVFQEPEGDHVVLEYMPARPLFDAIVEKGHFSEADAAVVMKQLLQFLVFMHDKNVVHRDIKPENLLLLKPRKSTVLSAGGDPEDNGTNSDDDDEVRANKLKWLTPEEEDLVDEDMWADVPDGLRLKVIDYGTANFCEAGQHLHSKIGTARYIAPEVLARDYDKSSDIWSAGVVLYILLCGHAPFKGSTDTGTLAKVKQGVYSIDGPGWDQISDSAKDLLGHMMVVDPAQRWTAEELLEHIWFQEAPHMSDQMGKASRNGYLERLTGFAGMNRMKRLMLKLLANEEATLTTLEVARLRELFSELDTDNDGLIDGRALHKGLAAVGCELSERDVQEFLAVSRVDTSCAAGKIDINEFIAALFNSEKVVALKPDMIEAEFRRLDVDGDGTITPQDLVEATNSTNSLLGSGAAALSLDEATSILEEMSTQQMEMDKTAGAKLGLTFKEFRSLMQSSKASLPSAILSDTNVRRSTTGTEAPMRRNASAASLASLPSAKPTNSGTGIDAAAALTTDEVVVAVKDATAAVALSKGKAMSEASVFAAPIVAKAPPTPPRSLEYEMPAAISDVRQKSDVLQVTSEITPV